MPKIAVYALAALVATASSSAVDADKLAPRPHRRRAKSSKGPGGMGPGCRELPSGEVSFALTPRCDNFNCFDPAHSAEPDPPLPIPWFDWKTDFDGEFVGDNPWFVTGGAYISCNDFNGLGVFNPAPTTCGESAKYFMCTSTIRFAAGGYPGPDYVSAEATFAASGTAFSYDSTDCADGEKVFEASLTITGADEELNVSEKCESQISSASGRIVLTQYNNDTARMTINFK